MCEAHHPTDSGEGFKLKVKAEPMDDCLTGERFHQSEFVDKSEKTMDISHSFKVEPMDQCVSSEIPQELNSPHNMVEAENLTWQNSSVASDTDKVVDFRYEEIRASADIKQGTVKIKREPSYDSSLSAVSSLSCVRPDCVPKPFALPGPKEENMDTGDSQSYSASYGSWNSVKPKDVDEAQKSCICHHDSKEMKMLIKQEHCTNNTSSSSLHSAWNSVGSEDLKPHLVNSGSTADVQMLVQHNFIGGVFKTDAVPGLVTMTTGDAVSSSSCSNMDRPAVDELVSQ